MDKKLYIIDGHALIFKMYYAFLRHPMINSKGLDTSILFGFLKYVLELIEREQPTHLAVSFDLPGKTFRHEMFPEYKGTRGETPQLVIDALEPLEELCRALKFPIIAKTGFEADDMIGSLAKKAEKEGYTVYMVTPDKDYGQLVSENIFQYRPGRSGGKDEILGCQEICGKYGIQSPLQVIDMLTICGDTADNVPGVKGVGEVGAGKLIAKYGSVKAIYEHLDELSAKQKDAFEDAKDHIELSYKLVTIKTDIPIETPTEDMVLEYVFDEKVADLFELYEFSSLEKFFKNKTAASREEVPVERATIDYTEASPADLRKAATHCISVDEEGCCVVTSKSESGAKSEDKANKEYLFAPANQRGFENGWMFANKDIRALLEDDNVAVAGYGLKEFCKLAAKEGIDVKGHLLDIELMHYLINPEKSHKIEILAQSYLNVDMEESEEEQPAVQATLFDMAEEDEDVQTMSGKRATVILQLADVINQELEKKGRKTLYDQMEEPLIKVLAKMETCGMKADAAQLKALAQNLRVELNALQDEIRQMADEPTLNISSPKQVGIVIYDKMHLNPRVKESSKHPTDEETLIALEDKHPIIGKILEFRGLKKLLSTYIEPLPEFISPVTGKIHTTFNQALTATGRLSSSKPNLQNIPVRSERGREIRKAFVPSMEGGLIFSADYSQIELRLMAHLSGDEHLTNAFKAGEDVHKATAAKIFGIEPEDVTADQRRIAKTANFGIMYGISAFGLAQRLGIGRAEAKKIIDGYFENFPSISTYIETTVQKAKEMGYVETVFGRRRYLPDINSKNSTIRSLAERNAINAPIQGTSADIIKLAMIAMDKRLEAEGMKSKMILQIHDELVFDAAADEIEKLEEIVKDVMENIVTLSVPLTVECSSGHNWYEV